MNVSAPSPLALIDWSAHYRALAAHHGPRVAVRDHTDAALTFDELVARGHAFAAHLLALGLRPGDPVASLLPNSVEAVWVSLAIKLGGFAEVPLGWGYTADEIRWTAQLSRAKQLVTRNDCVGLAHEAGLRPLIASSLAVRDDGARLPSVLGSTPGRIQFTSGTTGRPKGVLSTHARRWIGEQLQKACLPFMPRPGSRILLMTPFVHGSGLLANAWFDCGGEITLHDGVDPARVRPLLESCGFDAMFAPPTVLAKLVAAFGGIGATGSLGAARDLNATGAASLPGMCRLPGLRCIFTGTQPLASGLYERARRMFGPVIRITYGKTECINPITTLTFADIDDAFASAPPGGGSCTGWPAPGVEIRIGHPQDPARPAGVEDEIWLRAAQLSDGLITIDGFRPHEPDGWHATGDLGLLDDRGRLWLTGRVADVIKTGGYRVNPDEIESTLAGMHGCAQACITSLPSEYWGEVILAAVERATGDWRAELDARVRVLSRHKRPRLLVEIDPLPRNPQGKVSRRKLREAVLEQYRLIDGPYPALESRSGEHAVADVPGRTTSGELP